MRDKVSPIVQRQQLLTREKTEAESNHGRFAHQSDALPLDPWTCIYSSMARTNRSPSLIRLIVSVDVKHHVYLLTYNRLTGRTKDGLALRISHVELINYPNKKREIRPTEGLS